MILSLLLLAQLATPADSVYSSAALRTLIESAAAANHRPPPRLRGYRAAVETELALILRDTLGRERPGQIEQLASAVSWSRGDLYAMRVLGYRSKAGGAPFSALSFMNGWTEPTLYGERLRFGVGFNVDSARIKRLGKDTVIAVHPFAADRERFYEYSGGDTIAVLRSGQRPIHVVRIRVVPRLRDSTRLLAFDGEIDLDAERRQIVRMRGRFVVLGPPPARRSLVSRLPGLVAVGYGEFVNQEVNGEFWLPASQRTEFQSTHALLGGTRAVMRVMSRFSDYAVDERDPPRDSTTTDSASVASPEVRHQTTWARADSVNRFGDWHSSLGDATASVTADDFDDIGPDQWRATGAPRIETSPTKMDNVVRYNRVEGLYTGAEVNVRMRSAAPGVSLGAFGGWAWTERTVRGGVHLQRQLAPWIVGVRGERLLASTNDFVPPGAPDNGGLDALIGSADDYDYVDRRVALGSVTRVLGSVEQALVSVQGGVGEDRVERQRLEKGPLTGGAFRPNRGALAGGYALGVVDAELHPNVQGESVQPGLGVKLHYEIGRGGLSWQRAELSIWTRRYWGPIELAMDASGGAVSGATIPPQQLFELGGRTTLAGYEYKEFAGDHAALFRGYGSYTFDLWRTPLRGWRGLTIPGVSPGVAAGVQGGWTELSTASAATAAALLVPAGAPIPGATHGGRASLGVGLTLFSGNAHLGVVRPIDRAGPWRFTAGLGRDF
jgi:hypothetical protein